MSPSDQDTAAKSVPPFKVGDRVRLRESTPNFDGSVNGVEGVVIFVGDNLATCKEDSGDIFYSSFNSIELVSRKTTEKIVDVVNHPPHYTKGGVECIDAIRAALTPEEFRGFCKGNALKYVWRELHKGGNESLEKARWYLDRLVKP